MKLKLTPEYIIYKYIVDFIKLNGKKIHKRFETIYRIEFKDKTYEYSNKLLLGSQGIVIIDYKNESTTTIYTEGSKVKEIDKKPIALTALKLGRIKQDLHNNINEFLQKKEL